MGACWWHEVARAHTPRVLTYRSQQELQCLVSYTGLRCVIVTSEATNAPPNASRNGKLKLLAPPLSDQSFGACFFSPYCRSLFRCSSRSSITACSILQRAFAYFGTGRNKKKIHTKPVSVSIARARCINVHRFMPEECVLGSKLFGHSSYFRTPFLQNKKNLTPSEPKVLYELPTV